jgi:hypothetical protein
VNGSRLEFALIEPVSDSLLELFGSTINTSGHVNRRRNVEGTFCFQYACDVMEVLEAKDRELIKSQYTMAKHNEFGYEKIR